MEPISIAVIVQRDPEENMEFCYVFTGEKSRELAEQQIISVVLGVKEDWPDSEFRTQIITVEI